MALTNTAIATCRECVDRIGEYSKQSIESSCSSFEYVLSNSDFVTFAEGTQYGATTVEEINKLMSILRDQLLPQIQSLCTRTYAFLEEQKNANDKSVI